MPTLGAPLGARYDCGVVPLLALLLAVRPAGASRPSDLAPGAPELQEAELRLVNLLDSADAVRAATSRLQAKWVLLGQAVNDAKGKPQPVDPCAPERTDVAWRIEHFGAAWREAAQAAHAQALRVGQVRAAATAAPLVDDRWAERLRVLIERDNTDERAFMEASAWQSKFVRPLLDSCLTRVEPKPAAAPEPEHPGEEPLADAYDDGSASLPNGEQLAFSWERGRRPTPVAVLATGDGWVCPGAIRADDAVVLLPANASGDALACWSASPSCGCDALPVYPGGVLGPPSE